MQINRVGQVSIEVRDVDRAIKFYRDVLDIPFLFQAPGNPEMAFLDCGGTRLYLVSRERSNSKPSTSVVYFTVDSAQDAAEELKSKGVELESEPHIIHQTENYKLWMAFFRDPDRNLMAVMSEEGELMG